MKLIHFQLSGRRHVGDVGERLLAAAMPFGFDEVCATSQVYPDRRSGFRHYVLAGPSGVSATIELGFDSRDEMMAWTAAAILVESTEASATECFRALYQLANGDDFPLCDPGAEAMNA